VALYITVTTIYDTSFSKSSIPPNQLFYGNSDLTPLLALSSAPVLITSDPKLDQGKVWEVL